MHPSLKLLVGLVSIGVPVAFAVAYSLQAGQPSQAVVRIHKNDSAFEKDLGRVDVDGAVGKAELLIELAQAARPPVRRAGLLWPVAGFERPQALGPTPHGPFRGSPSFERGALPPLMLLPPPMSLPPPVSTRETCEESINWEAALAGYIKSRLRLRADQRDAWRRLEDAAEPAVQKLHTACERFPTDAAARASLPEISDIIETQLSARLELIRTIREPLKILYDVLTPEQRALLQPPSRPAERL